MQNIFPYPDINPNRLLLYQSEISMNEISSTFIEVLDGNKDLNKDLKDLDNDKDNDKDTGGFTFEDI